MSAAPAGLRVERLEKRHMTVLRALIGDDAGTRVIMRSTFAYFDVPDPLGYVHDLLDQASDAWREMADADWYAQLAGADERTRRLILLLRIRRRVIEALENRRQQPRATRGYAARPVPLVPMDTAPVSRERAGLAQCFYCASPARRAFDTGAAELDLCDEHHALISNPSARHAASGSVPAVFMVPDLEPLLHPSAAVPIVKDERELRRDEKARAAGYRDWTRLIKATAGESSADVAARVGTSPATIIAWRRRLDVTSPHAGRLPRSALIRNPGMTERDTRVPRRPDDGKDGHGNEYDD